MSARPGGSGVTRRAALVGGTAAGVQFAAAAESGSWWRNLLGLERSDDAPAEVFKRDAPNDRVWAAWQERGWVHEAAHYVKLGANVQCKVCPNNCILAPGDRSHCRNKVNRDGTLYTLAYANPCALHVDPVEKKPLFHFLPGSRTLSLATSGCVFRCLNCQNWEISQSTPEQTKDLRRPALTLTAAGLRSFTMDDVARLTLRPADLGGVARALQCPTVSFTYSEPTSYYEYLSDSCRAVRAAGLRTIVVTCGSIEERPLRELAPLIDAAHVDLKGFDEGTYRRLNSGRLGPILRTLRILQEMGVWFEVINLVVPTYTDDLEGIRRMAIWLVDTLGRDRPLHFSRFFPQHKLDHLEPTPLDTLLAARDVARRAGLRYVYVGNVPELSGTESTICPNCQRVVLDRRQYAIRSNDVVSGKCRHCGTVIPGVWA